MLELRLCSKDIRRTVGSVAPASARRPTRLGELQRHVAFALGGEAASRLTDRLSIPTSPDTLPRMAAKPVVSAAPAPTPKILGVDDWAWRRGHRDGIILVDLERNEVVDLLVDWQAEAPAIWLRQHPGIEVVARDRAGAYAVGNPSGHGGSRPGVRSLASAAQSWRCSPCYVDRHHGVAQRAAQSAVRQPALLLKGRNANSDVSRPPIPIGCRRAF